MKKILTAFFLAITPALAAEEAVEMYPDEMPKSQLVFTLKPETDKGWSYEKSRPMLMIDMVHRFFQNSNFFSTSGFGMMNKEFTDFLFWKGQKNSLESIVVAQCQYKQASLEADLELVSQYQLPKEYQERSVHNLSWLYVHLALDRKTQVCSWNYPEDDLENQIFKKVNSEKIDNILSRVLIVADASHTYNFFAIYNSEDELKRTKKILNQRK